MNHRVDALQKVVRQLAHVAEVLPPKPHLGQSLLRGDAVREVSGIIADKLGVFERGAQMPRQRRSDIAHVSRDEYLHRSPQAPGNLSLRDDCTRRAHALSPLPPVASAARLA